MSFLWITLDGLVDSSDRYRYRQTLQKCSSVFLNAYKLIPNYPHALSVIRESICSLNKFSNKYVVFLATPGFNPDFLACLSFQYFLWFVNECVISLSNYLLIFRIYWRFKWFWLPSYLHKVDYIDRSHRLMD